MRGAFVRLRFNVPAALDGERVDRGLALLMGATRSQAARLVTEGSARLGGRLVVSGGRRLREGELLEVEVPATAEPSTPTTGPLEAGSGPAPAVLAGAGRLAALVVFADDDLVVVDKPAGLVVHPGAGNTEGTLVQQLLYLFPDIASAGPPGDRPGIVHRLDKGTSGLLVVARNKLARENLTAQLAARKVERRYLAVVHGQVEPDDGVVEAPLGRSPSARTKMAVIEGGRRARTRYSVLARSSSVLPASLLACQLETGRTHQVRVHLAAIGHPVLADERYSTPGLLRSCRGALASLTRPWLHAARLSFAHPASGQRMTFESALPSELEDSLSVLGLYMPSRAQW
ncbi:MAG: RluA family pseudouridine synthase [Acidimicrobiales bacterium]